MGLYDNLNIGRFQCPHCRHVDENFIVQVHFNVGRRYESGLASLRIGQPIPGFPNIPLVEFIDDAYCNACNAATTLGFRIKRRVAVDWWLYADEPIVGLPENLRKAARRRKAARETAEREYEAAFGTRSPTMAQVAAMHIKARMNEPLWCQLVFRVREVPSRVIGQFERVESGWRRRAS